MLKLYACILFFFYRFIFIAVVTKKDEIKNQLDFNNLAVNDENLTLLDLESKLEDSLNFDEDFDDALSLATSCFE